MCCCNGVDAESGCELNQVQEDVRHLGTRGTSLVRRQFAALRLGHPLEVLQQFSGFHDQCRRKVLRGMELLPVPVRGETVELLCEVLVILLMDL